MRAFKRHVLWIEGIEDKNDLVKNWSASIVWAFKRHIQWIKGIEDENDLVINWSTAYEGAFKNLYYGLKVLRTKMT